MLPFFRRIRKKLADDNQALKYSRYAIGEIVLVVVGILIALQVNNWNENQNTRQIERKLLQELKMDLEETKADLMTDIEKARLELVATDSLYQQIVNGRSQVKPRPVRISMQSIYNRSDLYPKKSAYESLQAFGINLVSNDFLRKGITDLYELQLVRVEVLESFLKETLEKGFVSHLMEVSKPIDECDGCNSLKEIFSPDIVQSSNFYLVEQPSDELVHLLKTKYMAYLALTELYGSTETKINDLIEVIDSEIKP